MDKERKYLNHTKVYTALIIFKEFFNENKVKNTNLNIKKTKLVLIILNEKNMKMNFNLITNIFSDSVQKNTKRGTPTTHLHTKNILLTDRMYS